jgi:histidinol phosphatase-like enzyme
MNARLNEMVERAGAKLAKIYVCPHAPEACCACRKPNLALMAKAATELSFNPRRSVVVGDKESDIEFNCAESYGGCSVHNRPQGNVIQSAIASLS